MKTLSVLSRKGGAGKTTVAVSLAIAARQTGLKVVLADIDPMRSAAVVLRGRPEASSLLLETTAKRLPAVRDACRRKGCDLLIIDTPPAPESEVQKAIDVADLCLAIARPSALDLAAVEQTVEMIARSRRRGMIVLNQCQPERAGAETRLTREARERLGAGQLSVSEVRLRARSAYQHAFSRGQGVTEWDGGRTAAADILRLLAEVSLQLRASDHSARAAGAWFNFGVGAAPSGTGRDFEDAWRVGATATVGASLFEAWA